MIVNTNKLRLINYELVREVLKRCDSSTKNSLAKETGLSISTCRNILEDMLKKGEIKEVEIDEITGGRPSRHFKYNPDYAYIGVLYLRIEGDISYIYTSVVDLLGSIKESKTYEMSSINYLDLENIIESLLDKFSIQVFSLGIPGVVKEGKIGLCDVVSLRNFSLKEELEKRFPVTFILENDVNASALGYYHNLKDKPESIIYLYYPYLGIPGAGIVINGSIIRGKSNFAGEVGFLPLGVNYEDYGKIQQDESLFINIICKTILSLNSVINPESIVLSWQKITETDFDLIKDGLINRTPERHLPHISFNNDHHEDYIKGLSYLGLRELTCKVEVVKR